MKNKIVKIALSIIIFCLYIVSLIACYQCNTLPEEVKIIMIVFIIVATAFEQVILSMKL